jgi:outer membrane protein TolC
VRLSRLGYWPDFTVGFEWMKMEPRDAFEPPRNPQTGQRPVVSRMSEAGTDNWAITLGFNLPIWFHRIEAGIHEARQRLLASQQGYSAERNRVFYEIEDALARIDAQRNLAELFERTIIPEAEQAYRVSQAGYSSGRTGFLEVIESWRKWADFTIQYHRALGELERSVADLEQAVGSSLSDLGNEP